MRSTLVCNHPEQMQAVWLMRIDCQNLPVDPLSLSQPPGLMMLKSVPQHALNNRRRPFPRSFILLAREWVLTATHRLRVSI
jgi:hypothetical protein